MENRKAIITGIRGALTSNTAKELLIFGFFLIVSAVFWFLKAMNEDKEEIISIPVIYKNIPENVVITSNPPENIRITVRDKGLNLLEFKLRRTVKPIVFDFDNYATKGYLIKVGNAEIQKQLKDNLPSSTSLISFKPETFDVVYTRGKAKKVPVYIAGRITAKSQHDITDIWTNPDSVMIYAPQDVLDTITGMYTTSLSYHELTDSIHFKTELRSMLNVKPVPEQVEVHVNVEQLTEKSLEVPIETINVPEGKVLRTFPTKVKVTFQTVLSYYKHVNPNNFIIQVNYNDVANSNTSQIKPNVMAPSIIKHMRISPEVVEYLIEDATEP